MLASTVRKATFGMSYETALWRGRGTIIYTFIGVSLPLAGRDTVQASLMILVVNPDAGDGYCRRRRF